MEDEVRQCSNEGVTMANSVETLGVDLRMRVKDLGAKEKREKKEVQSEILANQEERSFPEELHDGGDQEVAASGFGASKNVESACSRDGSHGKVKFEETGGSSSKQKEDDFSVLVH